MRPSTVLIDERAWWQRPRRLLAATVVPLVVVVAATWWAASTPTARNGAVARAVPTPPRSPEPTAAMPPAPTTPQPSTMEPAPAVTTTASAEVRAAPAPRSILVEPGVHITPMGVPPGTVPMPAGPRPHDSEPEN